MSIPPSPPPPPASSLTSIRDPVPASISGGLALNSPSLATSGLPDRRGDAANNPVSSRSGGPPESSAARCSSILTTTFTSRANQCLRSQSRSLSLAAGACSALLRELLAHLHASHSLSGIALAIELKAKLNLDSFTVRPPLRDKLPS